MANTAVIDEEKSTSTTPSVEKSGVWFPIAVVAVFILFVSWTINEYRQNEKSLKSRLVQRTQDVSMALFGIVNSQLHKGAYISREELTSLLQALIRSNNLIQSIELYSVDQTLLTKTQKGKEEAKGIRRPFVFPGPLPGTRGVTLGLVRPIVVPRAQMKLISSTTLTSSNLARSTLHNAIFVLDDTWLNRSTDRMRLRTTLAILLAAIAAGALVFSWQNLQRSANLAVRLVGAKEKNRHLEEMRLAAAGLAHETRNPLNVVRSIAQSLPEFLSSPTELRSRTTTIVEEVDRINARLAEFIAYSKPREPDLKPLNSRNFADDVLRLLVADAEDDDIRLVVDGDAGTILADEGLLRQAIFNLIINAIAASPDNTTVTLRLGLDVDEMVWMEVEDEGPGVPKEKREDIFMPYFTMSEEGTGLGLAVVQQIAAAHEWAIHYIDKPNCGAIFRIEGIKTE